MSRYYDGMGRCEFCKDRYTYNRKDQKYCSPVCRDKAKYRRLYSSNHFCIVCYKKLDNSKKYCSKLCQNLLYRLKRNRRAVTRITDLICVRRHTRRNKYIQVRRSNIRII